MTSSSTNQTIYLIKYFLSPCIKLNKHLLSVHLQQIKVRVLLYQLSFSDKNCASKNSCFRMKMIVRTLVLLGLIGFSLANITDEECEDKEFHLDPDDCPSSYYRCYKSTNVSTLNQLEWKHLVEGFPSSN